MREIYTVGHAARPWKEFVGLLHGHEITILADIRRFPGSRHAPQFNEETMRTALAAEGIGYHHLPLLGGRRQARADSVNTAWKHPSFRGYADYMETRDFQDGLHELTVLARSHRVAVMCAETVWWKCHRSLVADALMAEDWHVLHILDTGEPRPHRLTTPARLESGVLTYHADSQMTLDLPE
jgi:uncharacterized protein (DUF488 family)